MKKKLIWGLIAVILVAGLVVGGTSVGVTGASPAGEGNPAPTLTVATPVLEIGKKTQVVIMGSGFEPGQEVNLLFTTMDGVRADVGATLDPAPVANDLGAFATAWTGAGRYCSKKLIKEGVYTITATDGEYNALATAPVAFYDAGKAEEEWPGWAKAY